MDKQNKTISELTPDQMDKVSGGNNDEGYLKCSKCGKLFRASFYSHHVETCKRSGMSPIQPDPVPDSIQSK